MVLQRGNFISVPSFIPPSLETHYLKFFLIQTKKKMPPPISVEQGHVLTSEAKEMGFGHSEQARMLNNFIKRHLLPRGRLRE